MIATTLFYALMKGFAVSALLAVIATFFMKSMKEGQRIRIRLCLGFVAILFLLYAIGLTSTWLTST